MALSSCLFLFLLLSFFLGADNTKTSLFLVVPSLHHPSLQKKNITTHARTIHTTQFISARYIYIYIFAEDLQLLLFRVRWLVFLSLKRNTPQEYNGEEERNHRPTTKNTRRLFVFVLNLRALIYSRACLSLFCALSRRRGKEEAQRGTKRNNNITETTV